jgi:hypothetical protein
MNIKKIIREEVDGLDWIRDISSYEAFKIKSDGTAMYINNSTVELLKKYALPTHTQNRRKKEILLGTFTWTSSGINYKFVAYLYPYENGKGEKWWKVVGNSGDSGFGWGWITKRNLIGKRGRKQIFKQIIDRFDLGKMV